MIVLGSLGNGRDLHEVKPNIMIKVQGATAQDRSRRTLVWQSTTGKGLVFDPSAQARIVCLVRELCLEPACLLAVNGRAAAPSNQNLNPNLNTLKRSIGGVFLDPHKVGAGEAFSPPKLGEQTIQTNADSAIHGNYHTDCNLMLAPSIW